MRMHESAKLVRTFCLAVAVGVAPAISACGESEPEVELQERAEMSVLELGRLGGRIYNEPERAEEILGESGLTTEQFEARVRAVTNDPEESAEYTRGFEEVAQPVNRPDSISGDSVVFQDNPSRDTSGVRPPGS